MVVGFLLEVALLAAACAAPAPTNVPSAGLTQGLTPTGQPSPSPTSRPTGTPTTAATLSTPETLSPRAKIDATDLDGWIVYSHGFDIWRMRADGGEQRQLTSGPAQELDPAWSPDRSRIAFRYHEASNEEVYVMNADGSDMRNVTNHPGTDYSPAWSPDGRHIAFASDRGPKSGGNDVWVIDADGSNLRRLTEGGGIDEYPSWSPDGSQIAYSCSGGRILPEGVADFEVCVMDADGSNQRQLTNAQGISDLPAWSPDGRSIAFQSTRGGWPTLPDYVPPGYEPRSFGEHDVYVMDSAGGNVRNVSNNGRESEQFPQWSPDGSFLVFTRYGCIVIATADGTAERVLTPTALCEASLPDWR